MFAKAFSRKPASHSQPRARIAKYFSCNLAFGFPQVFDTLHRDHGKKCFTHVINATKGCTDSNVCLRACPSKCKDGFCAHLPEAAKLCITA